MSDSNGFTYRYAICRPDGVLVPQPKRTDMFGLSSLFGPTEGDEAPPKPRTWDTREAAESALKDIRSKAAELGVGDWFGVIVQQLCTPFTLHDPAEHFADEVQNWLSRGGAE